MKSEKRKWLVLVVIVLKMIIDGLDISMLNIALPTISQSLGVTSGAIVWIISSYAITASATVLFFGRLGDMVGKTRFYIIGLVIYVGSSLYSGMANSLETLVIARILQGLGASCTMANGQGIITMVFPKHLRGRALGLYGGAVYLGTLAGPTLGGLIVAYMDWQYIFLLKIPLAIVALILGIMFFPKDAPEKRQKMDYPGALLYIIAIIPLLYSLQEGYSAGYASVIILSGLSLSAVAFVAFFITQRKRAIPLLDLSLFKNSVFSVSIFTAFIMSVIMALNNVIIPFYMQGVLNTPVSLAGVYMSISPIIAFLVSPTSGYLSDKLGGERLSIIGQIINCAGLFLMSTLTKESSVITMVLYFCIATFGSALFGAPNNTLVMSSIPSDKLGVGGATGMAIRNIGSSMGVAMSTAILYGGMSKSLGYRVTGYERGLQMEDAFMSGMSATYVVAAMLCALGLVVSVIRVTREKARRSI